MTTQLAVSYECTPVSESQSSLDGQSVVVTVVEAVADVRDVDPVELPPLAETIEPSVIDEFVASAGADSDSQGGLCFTYCDLNVFVRADGTVIVGDPDRKTEPTPLF